MLRNAEAFVRACHRQLRDLRARSRSIAALIEKESASADALPLSRRRCAALRDGVGLQFGEVVSLLEAALPGATSASPPADESQDPATLEFLPYLYRDWGAGGDGAHENARALAQLDAFVDRPIGPTLVLGAGACRLAYDLHRSNSGAELAAIDLDPVLMTAASHILQGRTLEVHETTLDVVDMEHCARAWTLAAPHGPVDSGRFHMLLADASDLPFADASMDMIVTPWLLDQVHDARDLISAVHRVLRPDGVWFNRGPLLYGGGVPVVRRFTREEVFELAGRCGFEVDRWEQEVAPHLVSELNGRGRIERVFAFAARKVRSTAAPSSPASFGEGPPAWILFGHLPVPTLEGEMVAEAQPALRRVTDLIDGRRGLDDIAGLMAIGGGNVSIGDVREALRHMLMQVHPECRGR